MRFAVRRMVRGWWARARGWWLISGAAAVAALVSAAGNRYGGLGASLVVAVVGTVAGVAAERGRARLGRVLQRPDLVPLSRPSPAWTG
ncbi:hypothetical protein AB0M46_04555 [Dactylosporangium sp. NPDC051485]|uniref:hypothetical protein n=1 Tax=Dactylosporangium sp. NPDC051485 TaxID=3154846 RepID=UPI00342887F1